MFSMFLRALAIWRTKGHKHNFILSRNVRNIRTCFFFLQSKLSYDMNAGSSDVFIKIEVLLIFYLTQKLAALDFLKS